MENKPKKRRLNDIIKFGIVTAIIIGPLALIANGPYSAWHNYTDVLMGRKSYQEWRKEKEEKYERIIEENRREYIHDFFQTNDFDNNGLIDKEEFNRYLEKTGYTGIGAGI